MNKQEMAEWLAENVLGWRLQPTDLGDIIGTVSTYQNQEGVSITTPSNLQGHIYSPDGFFAVWDAVEKESWSVFHLWECWEQNDGDAMKCTLEEDGPDAEDPRRNVVAIGKDRYEAFYNAVYEVIEKEKLRT